MTFFYDTPLFELLFLYGDIHKNMAPGWDFCVFIYQYLFNVSSLIGLMMRLGLVTLWRLWVGLSACIWMNLLKFRRIAKGL